MRIRTEKPANYRAIHKDGMTIRFALRDGEPIKALRYPEFYDIKITNACRGGCPYCYQSSGGEFFDPHVVDKIRRIFDPMNMNQRPFQIAYGGGEPTLHPLFPDVLEATRDMGIAPNYTTNGMHVTPRLVSLTKKYCDGVAVSCHPHLENAWIKALAAFSEAGIKTNLHIIVGDRGSADRFFSLLAPSFREMVHKYILLPFIPIGRGSEYDIKYDYDYLFDGLKEIDNLAQIGFGAGFHDELTSRNGFGVSLYEPEIMSKYIDLETMMMYPSSFDTGPGWPVEEQWQ